MRTENETNTAILLRAEELGYLIQESISIEDGYFILDKHTHIVIAGAQKFLAWDEVVRWVTEADSGRTLN